MKPARQEPTVSQHRNQESRSWRGSRLKGAVARVTAFEDVDASLALPGAMVECPGVFSCIA